MFDLSKIPFDREIVFSASRSSGPGGQHVNKTSTKVELRFNILNSVLFTDEEKIILLNKLKNKINSEGELIIISQESRSQSKNKETALAKFHELIERALTPQKKRIPVKLPKAINEKRLETKRIQSKKKGLRKAPESEQ
ncbi:MAG: hypothetical protein B6D61_14175 [Bacteroidetes bacterium 4484_249]|nr:MAG: hypothetical protein B6D61_14175 [Bacteroidetes bacterium 4484_249]